MTGCDPTKEEWNELSATMLAKRHVVFFDSAYQVIFKCIITLIPTEWLFQCYQYSIVRISICLINPFTDQSLSPTLPPYLSTNQPIFICFCQSIKCYACLAFKFDNLLLPLRDLPVVIPKKMRTRFVDSWLTEISLFSDSPMRRYVHP